MSLPTITGVARLTDDPELRYAPSGVAVCKVRLAFNERRKNQQTNEWEDGDVFFVDGTLFKTEAENVAESLQRGLEVLVTGRLKTRKYETREGETRYATELLINSIGPTLKYATAKVNKMGRSSAGQAASGGSSDDPWATATPATGGRTSSGNWDEEPPF